MESRCECGIELPGSKIHKIIPNGKKRPFGRPRRRWEDNTRMDLKVICINEYEELD